jgi:small subunit ribosomal protein S18
MARKRPKIRKVSGPCPFCVRGKVPDYKDYKELSRFLTERARILGKVRTGVCSKHQRRLSMAIKRARHLALLPFSPQI